MRETPADDPSRRDPSGPERRDGLPRGARRKRSTAAQTIGGVLFGFEQQVWRTAPPPQELVHHARPDAPVPAGDGTLLTIELPPDAGLDDAASSGTGLPAAASLVAWLGEAPAADERGADG